MRGSSKIYTVACESYGSGMAQSGLAVSLAAEAAAVPDAQDS